MSRRSWADAEPGFVVAARSFSEALKRDLCGGSPRCASTLVHDLSMIVRAAALRRAFATPAAPGCGPRCGDVPPENAGTQKQSRRGASAVLTPTRRHRMKRSKFSEEPGPVTYSLRTRLEVFLASSTEVASVRLCEEFRALTSMGCSRRSS